MVEQFMEETASQLTYQGIFSLNEQLHDKELVVFFRNNHFSALLKRRVRRDSFFVWTLF